VNRLCWLKTGCAPATGKDLSRKNRLKSPRAHHRQGLKPEKPA